MLEPDALLLDDVSFPVIPDTVLEDAEALNLLLEGHRGFLGIYDRLLDVLEGDARFVVRLLRRDWSRFSSVLLERARARLQAIGEAGGAEDAPPRPTAADAARLAGRLKELDLPSLLARLGEVAERCSVAVQLVPLGSVSPEVKSLFRRSVEAEELHAGQIEWLRGVLEEES